MTCLADFVGLYPVAAYIKILKKLGFLSSVFIIDW